MKYLLTLLAILASAAFAQAPAPALVSTGDMPLAVVKLYDTPCTRGIVLAQLRPEVRPDWREGVAELKDGGVDKLCWRRFDDGIGVISEGGVEGVIPHEYFSPEIK